MWSERYRGSRCFGAGGHALERVSLLGRWVGWWLARVCVVGAVAGERRDSDRQESQGDVDARDVLLAGFRSWVGGVVVVYAWGLRAGGVGAFACVMDQSMQRVWSGDCAVWQR